LLRSLICVRLFEHVACQFCALVLQPRLCLLPLHLFRLAHVNARFDFHMFWFVYCVMFDLLSLQFGLLRLKL
jgi:hypothetical protein